MSAVLGLAGVILGVLLNEWIRRGSRREAFAERIFERRLSAYEGLAHHVKLVGDQVDEAINTAHNKQERFETVSRAVHSLAGFCAENRLYLDEEIVAQCVSMFVGAQDIPEVEPVEGIERTRAMNEARKNAYRMISEESGIAEITRLFKEVNRPKINSPAIEYFRALKAKKPNLSLRRKQG